MEHADRGPEAGERPVLLITGSNRGTGRGIAETFVSAGYELLSLNRTLSGDGQLGEVACDLTDPAQVERVVEAAVPARVSVCVLNAGIRTFAPIDSMAPSAWDDSVQVNLTAPFRLLQLLLPRLAPGGDVFVIGSHAASHPFEGGAAYCATKAALKALVEVAILELRPHVRVTLVNAGAIRNHPEDTTPGKMSPSSVGAALLALTHLPRDVLVGEIELRPGDARPSPVVGIERLQHV